MTGFPEQASRDVEYQGCRLRYNVHGNPSGPPILLIQGVGVHGGGWQPQVETLASNYRCLTFDNRGVGRSQPVGGCTVTVEQMGNDALAVMHDLDWRSAHIVGHSLGGLVALQLALAQPQAVRSLCLLCTFADGSIATHLTPRMIWLGLRARIGPRAARRKAFLQFVMPPGSADDGKAEQLAAELEPLFGHDLADQPPIVTPQLRAMKHCNFTSRLHEITGTPTLVASAAHDPIAPPYAGRAIAAGIAAAQYVEFSDASHGLPISHAQRINALLLEHLAAAETGTRC